MKRLLPFSFLCLFAFLPFSAQQPKDSDRLGMALEYFTAAKYHEALLIFEELDKSYKLNPRFHAYMGVCYYHEWIYEKACKYLDEAIPKLDMFAPHERSVYYFANAESHFMLEEYRKAIPYYEKALTVCYDREKGDIYYRLGFCYMFTEKWENARDYYNSATLYYKRYRNVSDLEARLVQIENMVKGCETHIKPDTTAIATQPDSIAIDSVPLKRNLPFSIVIDSLDDDTISSAAFFNGQWGRRNEDSSHCLLTKKA